MVAHLTEETVRSLATPQSFERGQDYFYSGAIFHISRQGDLLLGECEGTSAPVYHLRVELDEGGVRSASCTCLYDWGGACKHVVALLLTFLYQPEVFLERKSIAELLGGLEKEGLVALVDHLVERHPDLYDELEIIIPAASASAAAQSPPSAEQHSTQVSEVVYRKQVKRILKLSRYEDDEYGRAPTYLNELEEVLATAYQLLDAGDAEGALIILRVMLEEVLDYYDGEIDYDGDLAAFIQSLGMPIAEAVLSVEIDETSRKTLQAEIQEIYANLDEAIEASELDVVLAVLAYGWGDLPDVETKDGYEDEEWMDFEALQQARLNVLERQGRTDDFLRLSREADIHRYIFKLLEMGRVDDAVVASQDLLDNSVILTVARRLREVGRLDDALALAERGLRRKGYGVSSLATWLAPLEELAGRTDMALESYRTAFDAQPSIELYRHLKRLSGPQWESLRPVLVQEVDANQMPAVLVDIYLEEYNWDAAIALAEKQVWFMDLTEKVAEAVLPYRPDWVIRLSLGQAESLILRTQSNLYPEAARWLERAKLAYHAKGQAAEWQTYIASLRDTYARRPALLRALTGL